MAKRGKRVWTKAQRKAASERMTAKYAAKRGKVVAAQPLSMREILIIEIRALLDSMSDAGVLRVYRGLIGLTPP